MDDRVRGTVIKSVQEAGAYLHTSASSKKPAHEIEKRCRDIMFRTLKDIQPGISRWNERNEGEEDGIAVCPLDGVLNYSRGLAMYGVMAAYIEGNTPSYGALYLPESDELLVAERGKGARLDGRRLTAPSRNMLSRAVVCCDCETYDENMNPMAAGVIEALGKNAIPWRNLGSSAVSYAYLALGKIDAVISPCQDSSHAAGYLIMQEAGATVTNKDGKAYHIQAESVVAAGKELHEQLLDIVKGTLWPCR